MFIYSSIYHLLLCLLNANMFLQFMFTCYFVLRNPEPMKQFILLSVRDVIYLKIKTEHKMWKCYFITCYIFISGKRCFACECRPLLSAIFYQLQTTFDIERHLVSELRTRKNIVLHDEWEFILPLYRELKIKTTAHVQNLKGMYSANSILTGARFIFENWLRYCGTVRCYSCKMDTKQGRITDNELQLAHYLITLSSMSIYGSEVHSFGSPIVLKLSKLSLIVFLLTCSLEEKGKLYA